MEKDVSIMLEEIFNIQEETINYRISTGKVKIANKIFKQ